MRKLSGLPDVACTTAFIDVDQHRASKGVLCSIENMICSPKRANNDLNVPVAKKQRCLELDQVAQEVKRLDVSSLFARARSVLRQPPTSTIQPPIGREQQSQAIATAVQEFVNTGTSKSLYVSGLPGTGKSHTVRKVLQQTLSSTPGTPTVTWINCMSITSAGQVYSQVASSAAGCSKFQLFGDQHLALQDCSSDLDSASTCQAELDLDSPSATDTKSISSNKVSVTYKKLIDKLSKQQANCSNTPQTSSRPTRKTYRATVSSSSTSSSSQVSEAAVCPADSGPAATTAKLPTRSRDQRGGNNPSTKHVVVLDEIDNLLKKSHADLVQLFLLPQEPTVQVLVIGIANSIDLTERMLPELKLKMCSPQLICFPAYTTKQLTDILTTCLDKLPCKLFEPSAVELCSRSVGTSSGDLRHALKACRAAVDELERQQQDACGAPSTSPTVTVRFMMGALARLASVRSSQFGAQATSSIKTLPNQQQLVLYTLSVLCRPRDAAGDVTRHNDSRKGASSLWAAAGTASTLPSGGGSKSSKRASVAAVEGGSQQVFVLAVGLEEAFAQYKQVCKLLSLPPCSRAELQHMAELLAQMALIDVVRPAANTAATASRAMGGSGLGCVKGVGGKRKGFGGLGGSKGFGKGSGLAFGQQQEIKLCLKASVEEIEAALKHNPALRCLVDK